MNRRDFILTSSTAALAVGAARAEGQTPWDWTDAHGPASFLRTDPNPLDDEFAKYPRCPYCGMMRRMWSHTRHLIVYEDDAVDGTCSLRCAAISLSLNVDRGPKVIYAGDAGAEGEVKPLADTAAMHYVIDPDRMGTMTRRSKYAYADPAVAEAAAGANARIVGFDDALREAFLDMAEDTIAIRKRRAERRARATKP